MGSKTRPTAGLTLKVEMMLMLIFWTMHIGKLELGKWFPAIFFCYVEGNSIFNLMGLIVNSLKFHYPTLGDLSMPALRSFHQPEIFYYFVF